jgi:hypothetical protein
MVQFDKSVLVNHTKGRHGQMPRNTQPTLQSHKETKLPPIHGLTL